MVESLEQRRLLSAQTITVTSVSDAANDSIITGTTVTLREAINYANSDSSGDAIVFASGLSGATISLAQGVLNITNSMSITGLGASQLTISGNNVSEILDISATTANVSISGLTLTNGMASVPGATIGNSSVMHGGAISNSGILSSTNDIISGNTAINNLTNNGDPAFGGGIYNEGKLTSTNDVISGNTANGGGQGSGDGGGIFNYLGTVTIKNDRITGNTSTGYQGLGGGIESDNGILTSTSDTISNNSASGSTGNSYGGGIYYNSNNSNLASTNDTISGNSVTGLSVGGAGIYSNHNGLVSLSSDTISGNTGIGRSNGQNTGGGILNDNGPLMLTNDTISGNSLTGGYSDQGGAIFENGSILTSTNLTITGNSVTGGSNINQGGGVFYGGYSTWNLLDSIVAKNTGGDAYQGNGSSLSAQATLIGDTSSGLTNGTNGNIVNPSNQSMFSTSGLANNGGPTQTIALAAGSPAIGAGASVATVGGTGIDANLASQTMTVSSATYLAVGDYLKIDIEIVQVTNINGTTLTVNRDQLGTAPAAHSLGTPIYLATDQTGFIRYGNDLGAFGSSHAIVVTTNSDATVHTGESLRDAITQANSDQPGDTINFAANLSGQTITLSHGELLITNSMTITGLGASQLTIDGNNASRIFDLNGGTRDNVAITGLTLQHGSTTGNGGAISNSETLVISNDTISNNSGNGGGGISNYGVLTSTNDTIAYNSATFGGGVEASGVLTSTNDTIAYNLGYIAAGSITMAC